MCFEIFVLTIYALSNTVHFTELGHENNNLSPVLHVADVVVESGRSGSTLRFTPACNKHDVCYACGVRNGWGRYQCDTAFKRDMYKLCESVGRFTRGICRGFANGYYKAVRNYGSDNYDNPSLWWCPSCPSSKGDPNVSLGR
ncbi:hypothetical protein ACROYT_G012822 [Oculina patagonica]